MSPREATELDEILAGTTALVAGIPDGSRTAPTPCPDFDVAGLVDHLIGWLRRFEAALAERPDTDQPDTDQPDTDQPDTERADAGQPDAYRAGDDPAAEFAAAARAVVAEFRSGDPEAKVALFGPPLPRLFVYRMLLGEYLVHGWDLARATDQPVPFTDQQATAALEGLRGMLQPQYRGEGKPFGEEVAVGPDATPVEQVVAFAGRDPHWKP